MRIMKGGDRLQRFAIVKIGAEAQGVWPVRNPAHTKELLIPTLSVLSSCRPRLLHPIGPSEGQSQTNCLIDGMVGHRGVRFETQTSRVLSNDESHSGIRFCHCVFLDLS